MFRIAIYKVRKQIIEKFMTIEPEIYDHIEFG